MSLQEIIKSMNPTLWTFAAALIVWVLIQSALFLRLALRFNNKNNLATKAELSQTFKTGCVSVIGPALSVVIIAISLVAMVGSAVTYMRLGVIGAATWEIQMAEYSAQSVGLTFGDAGFTPAIFVLCIFGMVFGAAPYFVNTIFTLKPLDVAVIKSQEAAARGEKKESFIPVLGNAAMYGVLGYNILGYFQTAPKATAFTTAFIAGIALRFLSKRFKGLSSMNMALAMLVGMFFGQVVASFIG